MKNIAFTIFIIEISLDSKSDDEIVRKTPKPSRSRKPISYTIPSEESSDEEYNENDDESDFED